MNEDRATRRLRQVEAPPLPEKIDDWQRYTKVERTLNDMVEDLHRALVNEDAKYRAFLRAVYDAHAVEGSLSADNTMAAMIIRNKANQLDPGGEVATEKLAVISMALGVVLRRYRASRKQRREMVAGKIVPRDDVNGSDDE